MRTKFVVIFLAALLQDALGDTTNYHPRLRKVSRRTLSPVGGDPRVLFLFNKPTKRPNKVNIIYINSPTGTPAATTPTTTTTTTRKPRTTTTTTTTTPRPHHIGHYPYFPPFVHPILIPVPGWTGNPPPPFVPPNRPISPNQTQDFSIQGTPTATTDSEEDGWMPTLQDSFLDDQIVRRKPKPSKKPRPSLKPTTTTVNPISDDLIESPSYAENDELVQRKKKPRPSRKPRPSKKPIQTTEKPDNLDNEETDMDIPEPSSVDVTTIDSISQTEDASLENSKKRPKPSRKPQPSKKPTQATEESDNEGSELEVTDDQESTDEEPPIMDEEDSAEIGDDSLANTKKKPKHSKKPKPTQKPQQVVEELSSASPLLLYGTTDEDDPEDDLDSFKIRKPARNPESPDEELDSTESLGPEKDLIVVQRKGKPMKIRLANTNAFSFLKLPKNDDWQRSLQRVRSPNYFFVA